MADINEQKLEQIEEVTWDKRGAPARLGRLDLLEDPANHHKYRDL